MTADTAPANGPRTPRMDPIETAPHDRRVWLWARLPHQDCFGQGAWSEERQAFVWVYSSTLPTHWLPDYQPPPTRRLGR